MLRRCWEGFGKSAPDGWGFARQDVTLLHGTMDVITHKDANSRLAGLMGRDVIVKGSLRMWGILGWPSKGSGDQFVAVRLGAAE